MTRIRVDYGKCVPLGVCKSLSAKYLQLHVGEEVEDGDLDEIRAAVLGCPTEALFLEED